MASVINAQKIPTTVFLGNVPEAVMTLLKSAAAETFRNPKETKDTKDTKETKDTKDTRDTNVRKIQKIKKIQNNMKDTKSLMCI